MNKVKITGTALLFFCYCLSMQAQTSVKLPTHTIIGTELSVDYNTNAPSTTVNTKSNVFDGNLNTYFASYERSGTWVGLDLSEKYIITQIAYAPRFDYVEGPKRLLLGIFEGANNADFSDAVPLLMVTDIMPAGRLTRQNINCSRGFRYVRYVGPNDARCNIAEIVFYGYKGTGNNSYFPQLTNLPTITISTKQAADVVNREEYIPGFLSIIDNGTIYSDLLEIRGRGHGSWSFPKKPYRIKLRNKVNLAGLPARERNWTLINSYGDKTLMRNFLAFDLSKRIGMTYTPAGIPVDVILNGEFKGCYQLCDQIEIEPERVAIQALAPKDITLPNLSGGYLLELDAYAPQEEEGWFYSPVRKTPMRIRSPKAEDIMAQQYFYIIDHYKKMEQSLYAADYLDPIEGYRKYFDTESFIKHFLVGEMTGNTDSFYSVYMYKERNNDIFKFGPVWDCDLTFDNDKRTYPVNADTRWIWEFGSVVIGFRDVIRRLFTDELFVSQLTGMYAGYRNNGSLTKEALLATVDDYMALLYPSQRLNFMRWNILNTTVHQNPHALGSFEAEVDHVKKFISDRIDWLDEKLGYSPVGNTVVPSLQPDIIVYTQTNTICFEQVTQPTTISITDMTGRMIVSKVIHQNTVVPASQGIYLITISDAKGNRQTVKRIIN